MARQFEPFTLALTTVLCSFYSPAAKAAENPLIDLFPPTEFDDANNIDMSSGRLRVHESIISSNSDQLGVDLNLTSPGLMPYQRNSDYLGQFIYQGLSSTSVLGAASTLGEPFMFGTSGLAIDFASHAQSEKFLFKKNLQGSNATRFDYLGWDYFGSYDGSSANLIADRNASEVVYNGKDGTVANLSRAINIKLSLAQPFGDQVYAGDYSVWAATTKLIKPDGEEWVYRYNLSSYNGVNINRLKSIVSSRGYALQFSYDNNSQYLASQLDKDKWYSVTKILKYNKANVSCDETLLQDCASAAASTNFVEITYDRPNYTVEVKRSNQETFKVKFDLLSSFDRSSYIKSISRGGLAETLVDYSYRETADEECGFRSNAISKVVFVGEIWQYGDEVSECGSGRHVVSRTSPDGTSFRVETGVNIGGVAVPPLSTVFSPVTEPPSNRAYEYTLPYYLSKEWLPEHPSDYHPDSSGYLVRGPSTFEYYYDNRGNRIQVKRNPKSNSTLPPTIWQASYSPTCSNQRICNKPLTITDPNSNVTSFSYDPAHGGVLTETGPAVGGIAPQKRFEYASRYAWIKNAAGSYIAAGNPIWVKVREKYCKTTAAAGGSCAGGAVDEVSMDYDYGPDGGPNNLLLRGIVATADGQALRTCFGYDADGRKVSETLPAANLSTCP